MKAHIATLSTVAALCLGLVATGCGGTTDTASENGAAATSASRQAGGPLANPVMLVVTNVGERNLRMKFWGNVRDLPRNATKDMFGGCPSGEEWDSCADIINRCDFRDATVPIRGYNPAVGWPSAGTKQRDEWWRFAVGDTHVRYPGGDGVTMTISREPDKTEYGATYKVFRFKVRGAEQC